MTEAKNVPSKTLPLKAKSVQERVLPREFPSTPELLIPLSDSELQELGTFTAIWSQIDFIVLLMVSYFTKTETGPAQLLMENMTTGPRFALLRKLCQEDENETKKAIKKVLDENGGLVEDRNKIIHGLWAIHLEGSGEKANAAVYYPKARKAPPLKAAKLNELSDRAASLSNQLGALMEKLNPLMAGDRPRRMFFGDGDPNEKTFPAWPPK